jgi:hypothetical protein
MAKSFNQNDLQDAKMQKLAVQLKQTTIAMEKETDNSKYKKLRAQVLELQRQLNEEVRTLHDRVQIKRIENINLSKALAIIESRITNKTE